MSAVPRERIVAGVRISNPDKILYPGQGVTKGALADYYAAVADHMLPHVAHRPVTMVRCPTGQEKKKRAVARRSPVPTVITVSCDLAIFTLSYACKVRSA